MDLIFLAELDVIKPDPGLIIWTSFVFLLIYFVLGKFAFKPIQNALKEREISSREEIANKQLQIARENKNKYDKPSKQKK